MGSADSVMTGIEAGGLFPRLQERFGLREDPLAMEAPFFPDAQRQHALETLRHLCGFGDMALLLTGAKGAGKTRILAELVHSESARLAFHSIDAEALTSPQALAKQLLTIAYQGLGAGGSPQDAVFGFFRWSESATRKGRRLVLLIDNADRVPPELIRLILAAHQAADTSQCAVPVFSGPDSLVAMAALDNESSGDAATHQIHLQPLVQDEMFAYLEPRVHRAGGKVSELLSTRNMAQINELSQGSFGRLKRVTPAVWLGIASSPTRKGRFDSLPGLRWPALAILLLGASWWLVSQQYDSVSATDKQGIGSAEPERIRSTISLGPDRPANDLAGNEASQAKKPLAVQPSLAKTTQHPALPVTTEPLRQPSPEVAEAIGPQQGSLPDAAGTDADENNEAASLSADVESPESGADSEVPVSAISPSRPAEPKAESGVPPGTDKAPVAGQSAPVFKPARADRFVPLATLHGKTGYTAQMIAGYEESTAVRFLEQYSGVATLQYTRTQRKGRGWFVVFYGHEESRPAMAKALTKLPKSLREHDSWVRAINTI